MANFVGTSNIFDAAHAQKLYGRAEQVCIRPERLRLSWGPPGTARRRHIPARNRHLLVYVGHATQVRVQLDDGPAVVVLAPETLPGGDADLLDRRVTVSWDDDAAVWCLERLLTYTSASACSDSPLNEGKDHGVKE